MRGRTIPKAGAESKRRLKPSSLKLWPCWTPATGTRPTPLPDYQLCLTDDVVLDITSSLSVSWFSDDRGADHAALDILSITSSELASIIADYR